MLKCKWSIIHVCLKAVQQPFLARQCKYAVYIEQIALIAKKLLLVLIKKGTKNTMLLCMYVLCVQHNSICTIY